MVDSVIFVQEITDSMCEWLNDNHVVHNIAPRTIGMQSCWSIWMSDEDMIYFKLKWSNVIIDQEKIQRLEELSKGLKIHPKFNT